MLNYGTTKKIKAEVYQIFRSYGLTVREVDELLLSINNDIRYALGEIEFDFTEE